jgi:2-(1,2-epoxy-1,2-dihydrophenyl)acetyl-CoA isomerase
MPEYQTLEFAIADGVATIRLNRPDAANGISTQLASELHEAAKSCVGNPAVRAVLLTGNGAMFSAGGDLKSFAAFGDDAPEKIGELLVHLHGAISTLSHLDAPVVVAVNGMAAGAGFSLACAGDLVIAARSARFTMAYTAIGLTPDGGASFYLPRLVGIRRTQELMLTNRRLSADEALDWGIITRVVEDAELETTATVLARELAQGPTLAYAEVKKLLNLFRQTSLEQQMEQEARAMSAMSATEDGKGGIRAFVEKRRPTFHGR